VRTQRRERRPGIRVFEIIRSSLARRGAPASSDCMSICKGNLALFGANSRCLGRHALQQKPHGELPGHVEQGVRQVIGQIRRSSGSSSERAISPNFGRSTFSTVNVLRHGRLSCSKKRNARSSLKSPSKPAFRICLSGRRRPISESAIRKCPPRNRSGKTDASTQGCRPQIHDRIVS
jgi:hypothetical protein